MAPRPDHNAETLTIEQSTFAVIQLKSLRMLLKAIEYTIRKMEYQGADVTLALRHVEDARMRIGKSMFPFDTGFVQTDEPDDSATSAVNAVVTSQQAVEGSRTYSPLVGR